MGTLTLADYTSRVLKQLRNLPTAHPVVTEGFVLTAINNAPNRLIRENRDLFPEHHARSWTVGPTEVPATGPPIIAGNRIPIPDNLLELHKVRTNQSSVNPGTWASTQEYVVTMPTNGVDVIGLSSKETTGWPSMCGRKDSDIMYWPTTSAGFECYFRLYGVSRELALENDDDTFLMDRDFDQVIVLLAASEVAEVIGWTDRASELLQMAGSRLNPLKGIVGRERAQRRINVRIAGMP